LQQPDREQRGQLTGLGAARDLRIGAGLGRTGERRPVAQARPRDRRRAGRGRQLRLHQVNELEGDLAMRLGDIATIDGLRLDRGVDVERRRGRHRRRPGLEDALELGRLLRPRLAAVGHSTKHLAGEIAQILAGSVAQPGGRVVRHVGDRLRLIA
jgi:hypothetical protein